MLQYQLVFHWDFCSATHPLRPSGCRALVSITCGAATKAAELKLQTSGDNQFFPRRLGVLPVNSWHFQMGNQLKKLLFFQFTGKFPIYIKFPEKVDDDDDMTMMVLMMTPFLRVLFTTVSPLTDTSSKSKSNIYIYTITVNNVTAQLHTWHKNK